MNNIKDTDSFRNLIEQSSQIVADCGEQGEELTDLLARFDPRSL